jgi:PII-like signaling protein
MKAALCTRLGIDVPIVHEIVEDAEEILQRLSFQK